MPWPRPVRIVDSRLGRGIFVPILVVGPVQRDGGGIAEQRPAVRVAGGGTGCVRQAHGRVQREAAAARGPRAREPGRAGLYELLHAPHPRDGPWNFRRWRRRRRNGRRGSLSHRPGGGLRRRAAAEAAVKAGFAVDLAVHAVMVLRSSANNDDDEDNNDGEAWQVRARVALSALPKKTCRRASPRRGR